MEGWGGKGGTSSHTACSETRSETECKQVREHDIKRAMQQVDMWEDGEGGRGKGGKGKGGGREIDFRSVAWCATVA